MLDTFRLFGRRDRGQQQALLKKLVADEQLLVDWESLRKKRQTALNLETTDLKERLTVTNSSVSEPDEPEEFELKPYVKTGIYVKVDNTEAGSVSPAAELVVVADPDSWNLSKPHYKIMQLIGTPNGLYGPSGPEYVYKSLRTYEGFPSLGRAGLIEALSRAATQPWKEPAEPIGMSSPVFARLVP